MTSPPSAFVAPTPLATAAPSTSLASRTFTPSARRIPRTPRNRRSNVTAMRLSEQPAPTVPPSVNDSALAEIGLVGLAVMGQNLALNIAESGFSIAVYNRSSSKVTATVARAEKEKVSDKLFGFEDVKDFVRSLARPRKIVMLVKAGYPVDATIDTLKPLLEEGDLIIDGGNEFFTNTERRARDLAENGILYMGMGVSGGEEGARHGPSLMPGGPKLAWESIRPLMEKVSAQVDDGPCVTYIGPGGSGNYVKMVHNGIEYGDMQLIGEAYDLLRNVAKLSIPQIADVFDAWNTMELKSFLVEITARILRQKDDVIADGTFLIDSILDKTGSKGTGMWTIQEAAARATPIPTIGASLEARYLSSLKDERRLASSILDGPSPPAEIDSKKQRQIVDDVRKALYASKICSYAQGMNLIRQAGLDGDWGLDLGAISRIWKGGCIIRAEFLDRIKAAYDRNPSLASLLLDEDFAYDLSTAQDSWRRVVSLAVANGIAIPSTAGSLAYYDTIRREVLVSAQMVQAQRDFFGSHTYNRKDREGVFHTRWSSDGVSVKQD